jgi:hypothetical protein
METTYTWEAVEGGTLMTLHNTGSPDRFGRRRLTDWVGDEPVVAIDWQGASVWARKQEG